VVFGRFLQTLIKRGYIPDVVLYSVIIDGFVKALKLQEALRLYHKMLHEGINPNLFTYTSLINGLSRDDRLPEAMELMRDMIGECWTEDKSPHPSHYNTWVLWSGWLGGAL